MCGRYVISGDPFELGFQDNYNVSPGSIIPMKTIDCDGQLVKWSFSPSWKQNMNLINCRNESMYDKPSFKDAKRCIIPFSGWYEWKKENNLKTPYYFYTEAQYFAGLYNDSGCLIVTEEASGINATIHHRQPVQLSHLNISDWFMGKKLDEIKRNYEIRFYEVSRDVNNPRNNNPSLTKAL